MNLIDRAKSAIDAFNGKDIDTKEETAGESKSSSFSPFVQSQLFGGGGFSSISSTFAFWLYENSDETEMVTALSLSRMIA